MQRLAPGILAVPKCWQRRVPVGRPERLVGVSRGMVCFPRDRALWCLPPWAIASSPGGLRPARDRPPTVREAADLFLAQPDLAASSCRSYAQTLGRLQRDL